MNNNEELMNLFYELKELVYKTYSYYDYLNDCLKGKADE
jgi:hypothetical protein